MKKIFNINIPIQHSQLCVGDRIHNELCQLLINATPKNISNDLFKLVEMVLRRNQSNLIPSLSEKQENTIMMND